ELADEDRVIALAAKRSERIDADRQVKEAEINARKEVETTDVSREQALDAARLQRRRATEQLEIARVQSLQEAEIASREEVERARIASDRGLDEARIGRERDLRKLEVNREKDVETALMDKAIVLYQKALEESAAKVAAEDARVGATEAAERVVTARDSEIAKRQKIIEVLLAEKRAEETRIGAEAERVRAAVEAEAQRLLNEAENVLTDQARYSLFRRKLLDRIEGIVRESVKPMEKIEGIRILQVDGLNGGGGGGNGGRSATDEVIDSALRYRVQAPLIDSIVPDIRFEGRRIEGGEPADKIGCVRDFRLRNGDRIREKLLGLSDYDMFCTYSILESPMGVENYVATLRLTPVTDGDQTFLEWTAEFDCAPER